MPDIILETTQLYRTNCSLVSLSQSDLKYDSINVADYSKFEGIIFIDVRRNVGGKTVKNMVDQYIRA